MKKLFVILVLFSLLVGCSSLSEEKQPKNVNSLADNEQSSDAVTNTPYIKHSSADDASRSTIEINCSIENINEVTMHYYFYLDYKVHIYENDDLNSIISIANGIYNETEFDFEREEFLKSCEIEFTNDFNHLAIYFCENDLAIVIYEEKVYKKENINWEAIMEIYIDNLIKEMPDVDLDGVIVIDSTEAGD